MISGLEGFYIIPAWANQATKIFIGRRMPHWLSLIIMELMSICLKLLMLENISYCGRIEPVSKPYTDVQPGEDGNDRKVWMFPIRPVPDNDVKKPQMFVFKDMDDYENRGKNVDVEYTKMMAAAKKKGTKKPVFVAPIDLKPEPKPQIEIPADIVGKQVKHKAFGLGKITTIEGTSIVVQFDKVGLKKMGYEFCMEKKLLEFI